MKITKEKIISVGEAINYLKENTNLEVEEIVPFKYVAVNKDDAKTHIELIDDDALIDFANDEKRKIEECE